MPVIHEIIDTLHTTQGEQLMQQWNIPERYCQVAKEHHDKTFDPGNVSLVIVRLVNKTCEKLGFGIEGSAPKEESIAAEVNFFGFSDIKQAQLELQIEDSLKKVREHYKL